MGRNDNGSMVLIHFKRLIFIFLFIFSAPVIYSQEEAITGIDNKEKDTSKVLRYVIKGKYPFKVYNRCRSTEDTKVTRYLPDGSKQEYKRTGTYWYTIYSPNEEVDGISEVTVTVDSVEYIFEQDGKTVINKTDPVEFPTLTPDFERWDIPESKVFNFTYSPYGEVIEVRSNMLNEKRATITDEVRGIRDPYRKELWLRGLSDNNMIHNFDAIKNTLPDVPVPIDSTWFTTLYTQLDGVAFKGDASCKLESFKDGTFTIITNLDSLIAVNEPVILNGIKGKFFELENSSFNGTYKLLINPGGKVDYGELNAKAILELITGNQTFKQEIEVTHVWELVNRYYFK